MRGRCRWWNRRIMAAGRWWGSSTSVPHPAGPARRARSGITCSSSSCWRRRPSSVSSSTPRAWIRRAQPPGTSSWRFPTRRPIPASSRCSAPSCRRASIGRRSRRPSRPKGAGCASASRTITAARSGPSCSPSAGSANSRRRPRDRATSPAPTRAAIPCFTSVSRAPLWPAVTSTRTASSRAPSKGGS